jgi:hypothetical protein
MTVSILPLVLVALIQSFTKPPYLFTDITTGTVHNLSAHQLNFIGSFCLIPFVIMLAVRLLRGRGLLLRNFSVVAIATLAMSIIYMFVILFVAYKAVSNMEIEVMFKKLDYFSVTCSLLCIVFALLANFLAALKPNPIFGVKNETTLAHPEAWDRINSTAASALTYIFLIDAVVCAYTNGAYTIIPFLSGIIIYYVWVKLYTAKVCKQYK